jgi:hypothetical protein
MSPKFFTTKRVLLSIVFGLLFGVLSSEVPFIFLHDTMRPPREILLTIPAGTAELVSRGQQPPSIPTNMSFVVGDRLIVKNEDSVTHKLGPLFIPANSSVQLVLRQAESVAYECTFQPGKYFGMDVGESLTVGLRIFGIVFVAFPMTILFMLYSTLLASRKKENVSA